MAGGKPVTFEHFKKVTDGGREFYDLHLQTVSKILIPHAIDVLTNE